MTTSHSIEHRGARLALKLEGNGAPVLFIQGVGLPGEGWRPQVDALSRRFQCLVFDNRGVGESVPIGCPVTVSQMADDALRVMDAVGWDSAHVVGHSLGGLVAQQIALVARPRVRSLALLCTFARGRDVTKLSLPMLWTGLRARIGTRRSRRRAFLELMLSPAMLKSENLDALAERLAPFFGHDLAKQPPVVGNQLRAMSACDLTARLPELSGLPTLVASAEFDRIAPPALGRAIATNIRGARYIGLAGAAHGAPLTEPKRINALLEQHLQSCAQSHTPFLSRGFLTKPIIT